MNATVERIVELLFEELEMTEEVSAIKDEVMNNCQERFEDMLSEGMDEDAAIGEVVESLKGMDEMLAKYPRKEQAEANKEQTFDTAGLKAVSVELTNMDVYVEPSDDDQVHVICEDAQKLKIARQDDTLQIEENFLDGEQENKPPYFHMSIKGKNKSWTVNDFRNLKNIIRDLNNSIKSNVAFTSDTVMLQLAGHFSPELRVSVASGDVKVQDVRLSELNASSSSGDIEVELPDDVKLEKVRLNSKSGDVKAMVCAREVNAKSYSGDVQLEGTMESIEVISTSGDVQLEGTMESAEVTSTSGDIHVQADVAQLSFRTVSGDADVECEGERLMEVSGNSVTGDITVTLPDNVQADVVTNTTNGDVSNDHHVESGRKVEVTLNTVSGDIQIN